MTAKEKVLAQLPQAKAVRREHMPRFGVQGGWKIEDAERKIGDPELTPKVCKTEAGAWCAAAKRLKH